jgi:hypothetical protein
LEGYSYIDHISSRREKIMHRSNYKAYRPDEEVLQKVRKFFSENDASMRILTLGATWCNTCANVKPSLIKIVEGVDSPKLKVYLLGGVKTTMASTEEEYSWARTAPPEFHDPKFDVDQIPMVFFFNEKGRCLQRIAKYPKEGKPYEETILEIAREHLA